MRFPSEFPARRASSLIKLQQSVSEALNFCAAGQFLECMEYMECTDYTDCMHQKQLNEYKYIDWYGRLIPILTDGEVNKPYLFVECVLYIYMYVQYTSGPPNLMGCCAVLYSTLRDYICFLRKNHPKSSKPIHAYPVEELNFSSQAHHLVGPFFTHRGLMAQPRFSVP